MSLMGRALGNNMINLLCYDEVRETLEELGLDMNLIGRSGAGCSFGNGGLGRLAARFLTLLLHLIPGLRMWNPLPLWYVQTKD